MATTNSRGHWTSSFGFVLAATGSAVGLGNVWRFPYITGVNGGGAFVLVYIGCVLMVGIPVLLAEFLIGRKTERDAVGAFRALRPRSPWVFTGWLGMASGFVILSYYSVVGGWVLHYAYLSLVGGFVEAAPDAITAMFGKLLATPWLQLFWHAIFMLATVTIVAGGISRGIELGNKIMMPALFFLLVGLLVYALQTPGASQGVAFLLRPRWEQLGRVAILEALGQALFSLSLGMAAMITYGSYLRRETNLVQSAFIVAAGDTLVAALAGLVVFPIVFSFKLEPTAGPSLTFQTLPIAFSQLTAGSIIALAFFVLLSFAALSSAISLLEVVAAYFIDERHWSRKKASWVLGGIIFLLGIPSDLSQQFLGFMDDLATKYLLPLGALLIALFAGWILNHRERKEAFDGGTSSNLAYWGWTTLIRWVSPVALLLIFLHQLKIF
jgi:NSS family neurotransmitter:Na+ symporter